MLELDIILQHFLEHQLVHLSVKELEAFNSLLSCTDPELFAWLMGHEDPQDKELKKLSPLSEIVIEPGKSKTYFRLILVAYLITAILIFYSSIALFIKLILLGFVFILLKIDWTNQSPCSSVKKIQFMNNAWVLEADPDNKVTYNQAVILIHNPLFQLIEFTNPSQKKRIVLFLDQITNYQLRLLHLKISQSSI